jgi:formyltetrahydrofolate-dependent phosphoribosylglycinamide formyltransferase
MAGKNTLHIAVFVSGRGSNLRAIHTAILEGRLNARIGLILTSKDTSPVAIYAREHDIPITSSMQAPEVLLKLFEQHGIDFIALAGYLKLIPPEIVHAFHNRILNIHPALLPAFGGRGMYGHHVHEAVIASGAKVSGATIHLVNDEYDRGPIVIQRCVPVLDTDAPEDLAARVLEIEHQIYPEALQLFSEHRVTVNQQRTIIANENKETRSDKCL